MKMRTTQTLLGLIVLALMGMPVATAVEDPNLLAVYWLDEGEGSVVWDYSGHDRNGRLSGAIWSAEGKIGGCLRFDGTDSVIIDNADDLDFGLMDYSLCAWIKTAATGQAFFSKTGSSAAGNYDFGVGGSGAPFFSNRNRAEMAGTVDVNDDEWHHVAFIQDRDEVSGEETMTMYVDAMLDSSLTFNITSDESATSTLALGQGSPSRTGLPNDYSGLLDEVYLYGSIVQGDDLPYIMNVATWNPRARDPQPESGAFVESTSVTLSWSAGWADTALGEHLSPVSYRVYLSADFNDVNEALDTALVADTEETAVTVSDLLSSTTYYWRVDEVNDVATGSPWPGQIWQFQVPSLGTQNPSPADGAKFQPLTKVLTWTPGIGSTSNTVYLGGTYEEVENATTGGINVTEARYDPELASDKVYYWRVDGSNGSKGAVWKFSTVPVGLGEIADPNLFAWWKLDEGEGTLAVDYSGYGHHATLRDNVRWEPALYGFGVRVWDGTPLGKITLPDMPDFTSDSTTLSGWIYQTEVIPTFTYFYGSRTAEPAGLLNVDGQIRLNWPGAAGWDVSTGIEIPLNEWVFVAASVSPTDSTVYVNNDTFSRQANYNTINLSTNCFLGSEGGGKANKVVRGLVDDFRIYSAALTAEELTQVMRGEPWLAWDPQPSHGSLVDVIKGGTLSWQAGDDAASHDVYVATNPDALQNADVSDTTGVYRGRQALGETSYDLSAEIDPNVVYYWRIDEVQADGSVRKGNPWRFTTTAYLIVDDFEGYTDEDDNAVWITWKDGFGFQALGLGGSYAGYPDIPYMETEKVNPGGSRQSMPVPYSNDGSDFVDIDGNTTKPVHSEVMLVVPDPDWTRFEVKALSVAFRGEFSEDANEVSNEPDRLYVVVEDAKGATAVFEHPDNPNAVQNIEFSAFEIPLSDIAAKGVDLTQIKSLTLGIGTEGGAATGKGVMYFDDIRLYPELVEPIDPNEPNEPAEPEPTPVAADINIPALGADKPILDGDVDALWSAADALVVDTVREGARDSDADCSGSWQALWDTDNPYVLVEITDDLLVQDSAQGWHDDRIELFIDADNGKTSNTDSGNDYQYNFRANNGVVETPVEWYERDTGRSLQGVEYSVALTGDGYRFEIKLPWTTLLGSSPVAGDNVGLALNIVDDDDGGDSDCVLSSLLGAGGPHSTDLWGTALLTGIIIHNSSFKGMNPPSRWGH